MLDLIKSIFENKRILVKLDNKLIGSIIRNNSQFQQNSFLNNTHNINVNLFKLIYATGIIQIRRANPTSLQKLTEKSDLLEFIKDCDEFCIKKHKDTDKKISISEDFGVGLSVLIADHYYKINWSTLGKIKRIHSSKPDINCLTNLNKKIVIEAKGTINESTRRKQKTDALNQKRNPSRAHVKIASCALLKENSISDVEFLDPSYIPPDDIRYEKSLLKADHYARTFNLIGQKELSKYFNLMRKRIIHNENFSEFYNKQKLFNKIKKEWIQIKKDERTYFGNIEILDKKSFIFIGIDESLLSVEDFINFEGYEDKYIEEEGNYFYILSDGLCLASLKNIEFLAEQIKYKQIFHHYDSFSIMDFDSSTDSTIIDFFSYLFERIGCKTEKYPYLNRKMVYDMLVTFEDKKIIVEFKKYLSSKNKDFISKLESYLTDKSIHKLLLITNTKVSTELRRFITEKNIFLIDRGDLKEIMRNNKVLLEYITDKV